MSEGHRHHEVSIKHGRLTRMLMRPRWRTHDLARVGTSPYPYGVTPDGWYYLSILSVLHRWTGLTLRMR